MNILTQNLQQNWELESLTYAELFNIFKSIIFNELKTTKEEDVLLSLSFRNDFQADSIDIISIILNFEEMFDISLLSINCFKKFDFLNALTVENLFAILYSSLLNAENNLKKSK